MAMMTKSTVNADGDRSFVFTFLIFSTLSGASFTPVLRHLQRQSDNRLDGMHTIFRLVKDDRIRRTEDVIRHLHRL